MGLLTRIFHTFSRKIATLVPQIGCQDSEESVQATRPHYPDGQNEAPKCASFPRKCGKYGLSAAPRYSIKRVFSLIVLSALPLCFALVFVQQRLSNAPITAIVQTGGLPTEYLAEILDIAVDKPTSLTHFDLKEARQKLLATHLISEVTLKKMKPNHLFIDYTVRTPIAILGNYTNTGIDDEGIVFPLLPAYLPKNLPELIIDASNNPWGERVEFDHTLLEEEVSQIDLTHRREIVLKMKCGDWVRLEKSTQQLPLYYKLQAEILKSPSIIDLRLKDCAFIKEIHE